jgi:hypothetical protein
VLNPLWSALARQPWITDVACPFAATVAGVLYGAYITQGVVGWYDVLVLPIAAGIFLPYQAHKVTAQHEASSAADAVLDIRRRALRNSQAATRNVLEAVLIGVAFPQPLAHTDYRAYCHCASESHLHPFAWSGVHREEDVHEAIPHDTDEARASFAIAEAFATGRFVMRDVVRRSELEDAMGIAPYRAVIATPVRRGGTVLGTLSVGSFRSLSDSHLDRREAKDLLMAMADAVFDLWRDLDLSSVARQEQRSRQ